MKILYVWLTMGRYHIARMKAIQQLPGVSLSVLEITNLDDHQWDINKEGLNSYHSIFENRMLSPKVIRQARNPLRNFLAAHDFDVIVNGAGYAYRGIHSEITKLSSARTVLWSESTRLDNRPWPWKKWIKQKRVSSYDAAIVAGNSHKEYLQDLSMDSNKIQVVGNVVDNDRFILTDQNNATGFLYVGRLLDIKNVDGLIRAYKRYREHLQKLDKSPWPLKIIGDGPERQKLENSSGELITQGIRFLGLRQPDELPEIYANASVFVLPSISEPWGLVTNEAMAAGLPVMLSDKCGSAELIEHGKQGFIFDPADVDMIADQMVEIHLDKNKRISMGEESRQKIKQYTPQTYADKCHRLFKTLL
ncbi:MAG: glycosyltransferase family 4 protein [Bacteroidota bacterium]